MTSADKRLEELLAWAEEELNLVFNNTLYDTGTNASQYFDSKETKRIFKERLAALIKEECRRVRIDEWKHLFTSQGEIFYTPTLLYNDGVSYEERLKELSEEVGEDEKENKKT